MLRDDASPSSYEENSQTATLEKLKDSIQEFLSRPDAMSKIQVLWSQFFVNFFRRHVMNMRFFLEVLMAVILKIVSFGI